MAEALVLDTTFLIERELQRGKSGDAQHFLARQQALVPVVSSISAGEFGIGFTRDQRTLWKEALRPYEMLIIDAAVGWQYASAFRSLKQRGQLIGTNDLWIAACCLHAKLPMVTRNTRHFERVPSLEVLSY